MKNIYKSDAFRDNPFGKRRFLAYWRKNVFLRQYAFKIVYLVSFIPLLLFTAHRLHRMRF